MIKYTIITGASGFLGSAVIKEYNKYNEHLLVPTSNELDLINQSSVLEYFNRFRPNKITHINLKMAINLFDAIYKYPPKYVCTVGTVCGYPENCPTPFKEDDIWNGYPERTNSGYGLAKKMLHVLQKEYRAQYGLKGIHLVPVNMYGSPGDHFDLQDSHVVPALIRKFVEATENGHDKAYCFGTGLATRELFNVKDCARAIVKTVIEEIDYPEPINLGTGQSILIKDLAHLIADLTGFQGEIVFTGEVGDGQFKRQLCVDRAKEILGFSSSITLKNGLIETIQWYKENKDKL